MIDATMARRDIETMLMLGKALDPVSPDALNILRDIEQFADLDSYTEQDVREEIIAPILRVLGYRKESMFSVEREITLHFAEKRLKPDYSLTLWEEHFWIVEAKRPSVTRGQFGYSQLRQALEYAVHPEINAALLVLCDGHAIEVFDREYRLDEPILRVEQPNLVRDFDQLRALLSPFQAWFFQKRRVVRMIDKVLDREFNIERIKEFEQLVSRRILGKEQRAIENMRALPRSDYDLCYFDSLDSVTLIETHLPLVNSWPKLEAITNNLIKQISQNQFRIIYQIFSDSPRVLTDAYIINSLYLLMRLEERGLSLNWTPSWLKINNEVDQGSGAVKKLIRLALTSFAEAPDWQVTLLHATAIRRLAKILVTVSPDGGQAARRTHLLQRFFGEELCFSQQVSSPTRHSLYLLDNMVRAACHRFLASHRDENGRVRVESARQELRLTWQCEIQLLEAIPNYPTLMRERDFGEMHPTESANVRYDCLGHGALCVIDRFPRWKNFVLETLRPELDTLVELGSWQARQWLGISLDEAPVAADSICAGRFFFGDENTVQKLAALYKSF
ncbi:MAG: hypothetical protein C0476_05110 [Sphingomonas sp.]|nr:hypothetical protein [Sphingomonas sp.]